MINGGLEDSIEGMDAHHDMPRDVSTELMVRAEEGFIGVDDVFDEKAAAMALASTAYGHDKLRGFNIRNWRVSRVYGPN
jgi:hypothetical protein